MNLCKFTRIGTIGAAAALLALSQSTATAQMAQRSIMTTTTTTQDGGHHTMTFKTTQDGRSVAVEIRDGRVVSATVDGKEIPEDRIRRRDNKIVIVDENGETIFEMNQQGGHTGETGAWVLGPNQRLFTGPGALRGAQRLEAAQAEPPPVMIGASLADPDRALRRHFGLEEGKATMLAAVYDGLPAAEAGLKAYDIIVSINGDDDAGQQDLREALRDAEPGDTITLGVIQGGQRKEVRVKLVKYDRERLDEAARKFREEHGDEEEGVFRFVWPGDGQNDQFFQGFSDRFPDEFLERMRRLQREQRELLDRAGRERERDRARLRERRPADGDDQLERLQDRLDRLERMLEKLAEEKEQGRSGN